MSSPDTACVERDACAGSTHRMPLPTGMTVDEMWAEVTILGELAPRSEPITTWVWVTCPGGHECACRFINTQPDPQHPLAWWQRWLLRLVYLRPGAL